MSTDTAVPAQSSAPEREVPTRRISFEAALAHLPRHFTRDGDLISSHTTAVLSAMFPHGEEYFVRSVRHFRDRIVDPALRRQVAGFIGQESTHGREHTVLNERLAQLGYPTMRMSRWTDRILTSLERRLSPEANLAVTAAFEHFTATMAEWMLEDEDLRDSMGCDVIRQIYVWHSLEELEHKAVAIDVYRAVGGEEALRCRAMRVLSVTFAATSAVFAVISMAGDRQTYRPKVLWNSMQYYASSPLLSAEYRRRLSQYLQPGFHPSDRHTDELVERWRELLCGPDGELSGMIAAGRGLSR